MTTKKGRYDANRATMHNLQAECQSPLRRFRTVTTHPVLDHPAALSFCRKGCWLMSELIPNIAEGQARNRFLVTMINPARNIPEVARPSTSRVQAFRSESVVRPGGFQVGFRSGCNKARTETCTHHRFQGTTTEAKSRAPRERHSEGRSCLLVRRS